MKAEDLKKTLEQAIESLNAIRVTYIDPLVTTTTAAVAYINSKLFSDDKEAIELTNFQDRHNEAQFLHFDELMEEEQKRAHSP